MNDYEFKRIEPGRILKYNFIEKYNLSETQTAKAIGVRESRINQICHNRRQITPDTAVRLSLLFDTTAKYWLDLQAEYNIAVAKEKLQDIKIICVK